MSELKSIRLAAAATLYNVSIAHIVGKLNESGFAIEDKPTTKLSVEMVMVLEKAFNKDRAIKQEADSVLADKPKKETVVAPETPVIAKKEKEEEKEILIRTNTATAPPVAPTPPPPAVEEKVEVKNAEPPVESQAPILEIAIEATPSPEEAIPEAIKKAKLEGPKVVGKVDLDKPKKKKAAAKEEVVEAPATKEKAPETSVEETPTIAPSQSEEISVETPAAVEVPKKEESDANFIQTRRIELAGPKVLGKVVLEEPKKKEDKKDAKKEGEKRQRERKRIVKTTERKPVEFDTEHEKKVRNFREKEERKKFTPNQRGNTPQAPPAEITEKEIEDKIRATLAKIQSQTAKSDRSKFRRGKREAIQEKMAAQQEGENNNKLQLTEFISVSELASLMNVPAVKVIQTCFNLGVIVSINQRLDAEIIELVAGESGFEVEFISVQDQTILDEEEADKPEDLQARAPIVTIMGHVDHGKTSLLDYIRKANVVAKEAGGITQHIGAYEVLTSAGRKITFLDTPGHEAFTAMRARGAKVTDVAVIVVAADDAVMPQTKEAINHAQSAGVPMIFAINKIDKDGANSDKIREQLAGMNLLVEEWGGKYQSQEISAKKGLNIDNLLDKILLESDLLELKANPDKLAGGTVVEAMLDKGRGFVATVLVQTGTLEVGNIMVCGPYHGKIKAMYNHTGERVKTAGPAVPVQILGLNGAPQAGEKFKVYSNEQDAKAVATKRAQLEREQGIRTKKHITLDEIGRRLALGTFKELNLIIKGDVDGSVEALGDSLLKLSTDEIHVRVIHKGVGAISESDVNLAAASDAIIIGFNVRPSIGAKRIAENENIEIKLYSIIYNAIEEVKSAMEGLLEPKVEEKIIGNLDVREAFHISKVGTIAGCFVRDGRILRSSKVRIIRDGIVLHTGLLSSLKRFKDDVKEVVSGMDCGVQIKDYQDIKSGDVIEVFEEVEVARKL
ncbi:MAG: translation initiation factor IF-2 [Chitinophagales bacterium]|nr:translation initiation factor IF-2 [Chitinophagales bacterium]